MTQKAEFLPPAGDPVDPQLTEWLDDKTRERAYAAGYVDCADGTMASWVRYVGTPWAGEYDRGYGVAQADRREQLIAPLPGELDYATTILVRRVGCHRKPSRLARLIGRLRAPRLSAGPVTVPGQPARSSTT